MYNLNDDNELDRHTKEAAERFVAPGKPNWEAMQLELDKILPVEKKRRFLFFWWLLPILLIGGTAAYWQLSKNEQPENKSESSVKQSPISNGEVKESATKTHPKNLQKVEKEISKKSDAKSDNFTQTLTKPQHRIAPEAGLKKEINKPLLPTKKLVATKSNYINNIAADEVNRTKVNSTVSENMVVKNNTEESKVVQEIQLKTAEVKLQKEVSVDKNITEKPTPITQPVNEDSKANFEQDSTINDEPKSMFNSPSLEKQGKGWSFGLLAGFDKSTVKYTYGDEPGYNIGLMVGYHFNNKWSLHTGANYTQKNYKLAGEDFTPPKGNWTYNYKIESVTGYCRMWELPILFRYQVSRSNKNSFYISSGLSSYFMTYENYTYFYYYNGQPYTKNNAYNSSDTHILSIAHFSAGFENRISKNLSLGIEPYAKIPLAGVGYGDIQLSSFGINFSVQYRQPSKK